MSNNSAIPPTNNPLPPSGILGDSWLDKMPDIPATPAQTAPEFHLDDSGKVRYMWMRLGLAVFRERVPLHVYKMEPERRQFFMDQIAKKLEKQLIRDMKKPKLV